MIHSKSIAVLATVVGLIVVGFLIGIQYMGEPHLRNDQISGNGKLAEVKDIEILILESFPVQVNVVVFGEFSDSCTHIDKVTIIQESNVFIITVTTSRPREAVCAQVITPFKEVIPLDVVGLKAGTYLVEVNGVSERFELQVDNILQTEK